MGNAFSKSSRGSYSPDHGSASIDEIDVEVPVQIEENGELVTHIETKRVKVSEYAKTLGLPSTEQYMLRDMLKSGYIPEEVKVSGILDNPDNSDPSVRDALLDRFFEFAGKAKPSAPEVKEAAAAAAAVVQTEDNK